MNSYHGLLDVIPVSYTHLDVYKRQVLVHSLLDFLLKFFLYIEDLYLAHQLISQKFIAPHQIRLLQQLLGIRIGKWHVGEMCIRDRSYV